MFRLKHCDNLIIFQIFVEFHHTQSMSLFSWEWHKRLSLMTQDELYTFFVVRSKYLLHSYIRIHTRWVLWLSDQSNQNRIFLNFIDLFEHSFESQRSRSDLLQKFYHFKREQNDSLLIESQINVWFAQRSLSNRMISDNICMIICVCELVTDAERSLIIWRIFEIICCESHAKLL